MLDEGVAREVVNRVQRLRKKAQLQPSDLVTVQYAIEPSTHDLSRVILQHKEYIETSTKNELTLENVAGNMLICEDYELKGAKMTLKIIKGEESSASASATAVTLKSYGTPQVPYINVVGGGRSGVVFLENPLGCNKLSSWQQVSEEINSLFDGSTVVDKLYSDAKCSKKVTGNVSDFNGATIFLSHTKGCGSGPLGGVCCPFVNVNSGQKRASLLLRNPDERNISEFSSDTLAAIFSKTVNKVNGTALCKVKWDSFVGQTLTAE